MLSLRVFHDGGYFHKDEFLGGIECPISDLLKISRINDLGEIPSDYALITLLVQLHITDIVVKLEALDNKRSIPDRGFLTLRLESDFGAVASRAVPQAAKISSATSAPKILTIADSVVDSAPDASVVISAAQDMLAPVLTLIESLDPIVEALNELAKVPNLNVTVLTWYSDNITPGPSFCQHRLGGCVIAL
jgi:hypothetical protein